MNHTDRLALISAGVPSAAGRWAEFGSGTGAFTLALAELLPEGDVYSVDQNRLALQTQQQLLKRHLPGATVHYCHSDFTLPLELPPLDGLLMANALHFVRDQEKLLATVRQYLRPGGRLLLVEYSLERGNPWVPYPIAFEAWELLASRSGFSGTRLLATRPSRYHREVYAALSFRPPEEAQRDAGVA